MKVESEYLTKTDQSIGEQALEVLHFAIYISLQWFICHPSFTLMLPYCDIVNTFCMDKKIVHINVARLTGGHVQSERRNLQIPN